MPEDTLDDSPSGDNPPHEAAPAPAPALAPPEQSVENALRDSERRFRALIEHGYDAITLIDLGGTVRYASPSTARVLGYTPEEFVGRNVFDFMHPDDAGWTAETFAALVREPGATAAGEFRFRHRDGSWRWIRGSGTNLIAEPAVAAIVSNYHDITGQKQLEEALRQRAAELAEANRLKDEFLATLGHELRNPLAPLLNSLHVMRHDASENPAVQQARLVAERQVRHLTHLVDELLDVSRLTTGKIRLRRERVELGAVVARAAEAARLVLDARQHELAVTTPAEPVWLEADPTRLEQVLTNLLSNAAKYTDPGGRVVLGLERHGGEAVLSVRDNGMGIDAKVLPHVFDLFAQSDRATDRSQGGLGVGLTVVRKLVELHGGSVAIASAGPGQGTEVTVRLPLPAETPPVESERQAEGTGAAATPLRILIVEDNVDAAESLAMVLRLGGHEVQVAFSGPAGLEAAEASPPDVVLLDIGLPRMDGYEVARRLRRHPTLGRTPLFALSGYSKPVEQVTAEEQLFDQYLVKPVEPERLQELLAVVEQNKRGSRS
jgi:two-component system CheB/CheR fusion protein